jgi:hypothetical protein
VVRTSSDSSAVPDAAPPGLLADLHAFFQEHRRCDDLDSGVEGRPRLDDVYVRRGDQPSIGAGWP